MSNSIERKFMRHLINVTPSEDASYEVIGKDLEEYNIEMNPETETKQNILGETSVKVSSYAPQGSVEPYYAEKGSKLFEFLQDIVDNRKLLDDVKTDMLEVHLWTDPEGTSFEAYREEVFIEISSYGGDTTGYQIPFNVHYTGVRTKGTYDTETKKFTESVEI